jgi:hypothetical protein
MGNVIDSFLTPTESIVIQPGDVNVPWGFIFTPAASDDARGAIPYGTVISSVEVTGLDSNGDEATGLVTASAVNDDGDKVTVLMSWPTAGEGTYRLEIILTLDTGAKREFDFNRVVAKDIS